MKYTIKIEGITFQMPEEVAASDDLVRRALAPYYPGAVTADLRRSANPQDEQETFIEVVKRAGTKGRIGGYGEVTRLLIRNRLPTGARSLLESLRGLSAGGNTAALTAVPGEAEILQMDDLEQIALERRISWALKRGQEERSMLASALKSLRYQPSRVAPESNPEGV